jgi:superfamily II DNA helicase RecQ
LQLVQKRDVFVLTATGSGKSLYYQLALVASPGKTILAVFPLLSLMNDQVSSFVQ